MNLKSLGWSSFGYTDDIDIKAIARITAVHRSHLEAAKDDKKLNIHLSGGLETQPVVGDWVVTTPEFVDEQGKTAAVAREVLKRESIFARWTDSGEQAFAANINTVFIVTSANQDFNYNRLHRYVLLVQKGGAKPVVVLSKADLSDSSCQLAQEIRQKLKVEVIAASSLNGTGLDELLTMMPIGSTSVFVGSSGVGKSSLVNKLLGEEIKLTRAIREDDAKGRHTTTARQLVEVASHGVIIDTPGIREVQVFGGNDDVASTFPYIDELTQACRFGDCQHQSEPGCAILEALESGALDETEWQSYLKLQKEVAHVQRKQNKADMANAKKRWKEISQFARAHKKGRGFR